MDLSIVIPSYNQPKTIQSCIVSLLKQETKYEFELIIVDSSTKKLQEEVEQICAQYAQVRLLKRAKQTYPGTARNLGIKSALSENIALIDADCVALDNWMDEIVENLDEKLVLSGIIENGTPKSVFGSCSYLVEFNHFTPFNEESRPTDVAATCNFAAKKNTFELVGYFTDHRAFEDMLFCKKLIDLDGRIELRKKVRVKHMNRTDLSHVVNNQKLLGKYSAAVRKEFQLPPRTIFKYPLLAFTLAPYRFFSILFRLRPFKNSLLFLLYSPIILYILFQWTVGFKEGAEMKVN